MELFGGGELNGKWTCISLALFPVHWPLKALYNTRHIHPFMHTFVHWWERLPCKVATCSSGAIWGSASCSRTLWLAAGGPSHYRRSCLFCCHFVFSPLSFSISKDLVSVKYLEGLKRSRSAPTDAPLSRRKHCSWNASSAVPLLLPWLCDITMPQHVTHLHNL